MRIASTMMSANYLRQLNKTYEQYTKLMEQSDGSKLHRASDDVVGYSKYLRYQNNKISNESPIGQSLIGKKKGAVVDVNTPSGVLKYKIISISID